jgi:CBS domain-containing protein
MQLRDIMSADVEVIAPEASIREAAEKMKDLDVGPLPVCNGDKLIGMLTDRDIVVRAVALGKDPGTTSVEDAMSPKVVYCFDDDDSTDAAQLMQKHQIRRLPIVNRERKLVGIVSLGDIACQTHDEQLSGETIREVSEPAKTH